ncbi:MAG: ribosome biogenesis GTPase Der, partial [Alphaproteobacteria bacterium]|nr:ribosome biogenesis GTPase Der [Alphaproteobacteria bacterium]
QGMREQALKAIDSAHVICFMIDGMMGCTPYDMTLAKEIRKVNKPVIIVVNKSEGKKALLGLSDAAALGLSDDIIPISAEHGTGMGDLHSALARYEAKNNKLEPHEAVEDSDAEAFELQNAHDADGQNPQQPEEQIQQPIQIVIMGRPNAGKSTLFNTLIGEERQLTGDIAGLTRDAVHHPFTYNNIAYTLIDTAGMRKRARVQDDVEYLATVDAQKALRFAHVSLLLIDGTIPLEEHIEKQDLTLAQMILEQGRALVIVINKWDKVKDQKNFLKHFQNEMNHKLAQGSTVPIITISAISKHSHAPLMRCVEDIYEQWNRRIPTAKLNQWFDHVVTHHSPPIVGGQRIKLKYITQIKARPPSFVVFGTKSKDIPKSYERYLINSLRQDFKLTGVPIRLHFKSPKNPYQ